MSNMEHGLDTSDRFKHAVLGNGSNQLLSGPVVEQEILQWYFRVHNIRAHPVCTDQFIEKSKEAYGVEWLAREIPQNFVDHNPLDPGTLNGVEFEELALAEARIRFTTTGKWDFHDATALLSLHSEKPDGHKSAGGNGIGIKQAALLLLRDYGVDRFEIQGAGWSVNYRIITAQEINAALADANELSHKVRNNWLVGEFNQIDTHPDRNAYIIETSHPKLIENLRLMPLLGVSDSHPALQDPDYSSAAGSLEWILPAESGKLQRGALFLNGQIMNAQDKGSSGHDYWHGPYGLTVRLNQVEYEMSMDRPPVTTAQFRSYIGELIDQMTRQEMIDQLRKSEPLWNAIERSDDPDSRQDYSPESHFECHALLYKIASALRYSDPRYTYEDFKNDFPERKYLVREFGEPSEEQLTALRENGYTLLPRYFQNLGIPEVSSLFKSADKTFPTDVEASRIRMAKSSGIEISYTEPAENSPMALAKELRAIGAIDLLADDASEKVSIRLPLEIDGDLLAHPLPQPKLPQQKLLSQLRGLIFHLLDSGVAQNVSTHHPKYSSTYSLGHDSALDQPTLQTRIADGRGNADDFKLELSLTSEGRTEFLNALRGEDGITSRAESAAENSTSEHNGSIGTASKRNWRPALMAGGGVAVVAGLVIGVPALIKKIDWSGLNLGSGPGKSRSLNSGGGFGGGAGRRLTTIPKTNYSQLSRQFGARSGGSLEQLIAQNDHTDIRPGSFREESYGFDSHSPDDPEMEFSVVQNPTPAQLERLRILLTFFELCTNLEVTNNLFIYQGDGSKGLNIGGNALGINIKLIDAEFDEAMTTWAHEVAHNQSMGHGLNWETTRSSIDAALRRKQAEIMQKQRDNVELSSEEIYIRDARDLWDSAR